MGLASNQAGFYDDNFTNMVLTVATEPDGAKRKQLYSRLDDFLLDAAYVHVISAYSNIMAGPRCGGRNMCTAGTVVVAIRYLVTAEWRAYAPTVECATRARADAR